MTPRKYAIGNWKMHGLQADLAPLAQLPQPARVQTVICLPATLIARAGGLPCAIGAQDCHTATHGAHTGDLSAAMLADAGATYVITGHSERRSDHGETDRQIAAKSQAAHEAGLTAILCIGETGAERDSGQTLAVLTAQLAGSLPATARPANTIIAYEPVWAIGTGKIPQTAQIAQAHDHIRAYLAARLPEGAGISLLYGGSVKPGNAAEIFAIPAVDGALVGGASLQVADFAPIITALASA